MPGEAVFIITMRYAQHFRIVSRVFFLFISLILFSACNTRHREQVDELNDLSYAYHYQNLDSVSCYADRAIDLASDYPDGMAEALNNKVFVSIAKMQYQQAYRLLDSLVQLTDNQVELLIADVQYMRLCQRESRNRDFYTYKESAMARINRIEEGYDELSDHLKHRFFYGQSEYSIVTSTYYYYVGLEEQSANALLEIDSKMIIENDTAQYLNYLYNIGAGGIINEGSQDEINQIEFDHLLRCYMLSTQNNYPFWTANAMQAISEHLTPEPTRLIADNLPAMKYLNPDNMPDSLLAGYLAQKSLDIFTEYGDVYQVAGSYRTLSQCYWSINDYPSSLICLQEALTKDTLINQAPDLVASIREQLSVVYAAMNDKHNSDLNRNFYLDKQEQTRQDRYLESRADQLNKAVAQTNLLIFAVVAVIILTIVAIGIFIFLRRKKDKNGLLDDLALPLKDWEESNRKAMALLDDRQEEIAEQQYVNTMLLAKNKKENLEQRAKISLVNSITPFIDRMLHEIDRLNTQDESPETREKRYEYVNELTDKIIEYNEVLTQWIQLRQGQLNLHIESFPLQALFDIIDRGKMGFSLKGIQLEVEPTEDVVKADRILTLFMINTMADNARKFTKNGGEVQVYSTHTDQYVEISVKDTGVGMSQEKADSLFDTNILTEKNITDSTTDDEKGHGFGLLNCKGIIEKYKKISNIFSVCAIGVESRKGEGSRFFFRLPKGIARALLILGMSLWGSASTYALDNMRVNPHLAVCDIFADSAYTSNIDGKYENTLRYADSIRTHLNAYYLSIRPTGVDTLHAYGAISVIQPEIIWLHDSIPVDYDMILSMRNESAVAALALHEWDLYKYNNKVYTQLFKERSADHTLGDYCRVMQKSKASKDVAVIILVLLLIFIALAYFVLYYRHQVYYKFCLEKVKGINDILLSEKSDKEKYEVISKMVNQDGEILPDNLQTIVSRIQSALENSISHEENRLYDINLAEDDLRKTIYEHEKLYVCNSVLDNCLSTLKHETMYYPSRIKMLIEEKEKGLDHVHEMAHYYKELYALLSMQATRQLAGIKPDCRPVALNSFQKDFIQESNAECILLCDPDMLSYLFDILKKQNSNKKVVLKDVKTTGNNRYAELYLRMDHCRFSEEECEDLFFPSSLHIPFLLCRQIVRDIGEATNFRGCGIRAQKDVDTGTDIVLTLAIKR